MKVIDRPLIVLVASGLCLTACGGAAAGGGGASQFVISEVSNGFGRMLPHQIAELDSHGNPTTHVIEVTRIEDLQTNLRANNPIRPPVEWPTEAVLPSRASGNHFIYARFTQDIDVLSVLAPSVSANVSNNMTGAIQVVSVNASNGQTTALKGRAFVGGKTFGPTLDPDSPGDFLLESWVTLNTTSGDLEAATIDGQQPGLGFPGTGASGGFAGDDVLVDPKTFVFVIDADSDLTSFETFPAGLQIQMRINEDVAAVTGRHINQVGMASSTVGADTISPEVLGARGTAPVIIPGDGENDVDPETNIEIQFTEPIQLLSIAQLESKTPPTLSSTIQIVFGPSAARVEVPYFVRPFSVYDLSRLELVPAYNFPGSGPQIGGLDCAAFGTVTITVNAPQLRDLSSNLNTIPVNTTFTTREGTGLVNAPVVPDAIYVGRGGNTPGISVVDMFGFGQSTGDPTYDQAHPIKEGNTNFPNNPNVSVLGAVLIPPLAPGNCTVDGGSAGVFTLTKDSSLSDLLATTPLLDSVGDMSVGHALDNTFNNASPFGCQAGGGNICASTGLKRAVLASGGANSLAPSTTSTLPVKIVQGGENLVSFSPAPNPPPIVFPPLCLSPLIASQEPTSVYVVQPPPPVFPPGLGLTNLLVPGSNSRGNPTLNKPPTNLLVTSQNSFFDGPSAPQPSVTFCIPFITRQQIGHFLYVIDRVAGEIVVLNSNRFTVIDRIRTPDPTNLAMSPNLDLLAVTNESADQVTFISTDPASSQFHKVVRSISVGAGPTGIAWEPGNEDIFVCNQRDGSVTILSAFSLRPRKVLRNQLTRPIDVALTPRQLGFGFRRGVYFGYVLNQNGKVAFFESGPDGVNGWGFDDIIGSLPFTFFQPKAIQPDMQRLNSAVWIAHENPLDANGDPTGQTGGAMTNAGIASGNQGIIPLNSGPVINPQFRNLELGVFVSIGEGSGGLSGVPVDMAFDDMLNVSALTNYSTQFSAGQPLSINGKASIRFNGGGFAPTAASQYMFLAVPNPGVIDVLELSTGTVRRIDTNVFQPGIQSIPAPNANVVADYFRQ